MFTNSALLAMSLKDQNNRAALYAQLLYFGHIAIIVSMEAEGSYGNSSKATTSGDFCLTLYLDQHS